MVSREKGIEKLEFVVPSIHCDGCVQIIRDALSRLPAVNGVDGKPKQKHLTVSVKDGSLSRQEIADEISRLGHIVE